MLAKKIPLVRLERKKQKLQQLSEQVKLNEEIAKTFPKPKVISSIDAHFSARTLSMTFFNANATEINNLLSQIRTIEYSLKAPQTHPVSLASSIYVTDVPVNKRPLMTLGLCLFFGVFLGLVVTWMLRVVPEICQQMRVAEVRAR